MEPPPLSLAFPKKGVEINATLCRNGHDTGRRSDGKCRGCYRQRKARHRAKVRAEKGIVLRCEAIAAGNDVYIGKPCRHNHDGRRRVKTRECVTCYEIRHAKWREQLAEIEARKAAGELTGRARQKRRWHEKRSRIRAAKKAALAATLKSCLRCNADKPMAQFLCTFRTTHPDWCVKCRASVRNHESKTRTGRYAQAMVRRAIAEKRQTPRWNKPRDMNLVYGYAKFLRDNGIDCHVDHIVPLRGETASGLHCADNLRVLIARDNVAKSNAVPNDALEIPSEWHNPVFVSWANRRLAG